jgi:ethanolamine transporter EutH
MSIQEKQVILSLFNTVLVLVVYSLWLYSRHLSVSPEMVNDFRFWGRAFIILVPVTIAVQIVMHILFHIVNAILSREPVPEKEDERDKLIELKSIRIAHWIFIAGFFLAMGSQALSMQPWVMFVLLISSGFIAGMASDVAKIFYYRRGI